MNVDVNVVGVLAGAAAGMVVGSVWYSKILFGSTWMKLVGLNDKQARKGAVKSMIGAALTSIITAFVLAHITGLSLFFYGDYGYLQAALVSALWVWFGFQFTLLAMNGMFEQRPKKLVYINMFGQLASILAMALAIGYVGQ